MIDHIEITGVHTDTTEKLRKYVQKRMLAVERQIPRHARKSVRIEVKLIEHLKQKTNQCEAEAIVHLPKERLAAKEATVNMFAAIDIVELKLKNQVKKYKGIHTGPRTLRKLSSRFMRKTTTV
jgi:ribosomal subunit interface protein